MSDVPAEPVDFCWLVRSQLADLLAAGFRLPDVEPSSDDMPSTFTVERWAELLGALQAKLGNLDLYSSNLVTRGADAGGVTVGSLADDLADIWCDLRAGFNALDAGSPWQDVAWEWRFGLQTHWGKHAVEALRALHDA